uniref:Uncharacterized protein n=1 Tax=viral metagenome TaxID=1070528 RepID=A0A6C0HSA2_9ZZZZ
MASSTNSSEKMFSGNCFRSIDFDFSSHPRFIEQEEIEMAEQELEGPPALTRQTNEWILFCGRYPLFCGFLSLEEHIPMRIEEGNRHVVGVKIQKRSSRDVVRKIGEFTAQLSMFNLQWRKTPGVFTVEFNVDVIFRIYVCDDSGMFHILADITGELTPENKEKLNKLIYCVRVVFQDNDPLPESTILTPEKWAATYDVTQERP